jgi:hypothetical protein
MALPLSSNPLNVAARTLTGSNPSHSLKAAETVARCAYTCQGSKRVTEASRGVWRVICCAYGLGKNRSRPDGLHHLARNGWHHLARTSEHRKLEGVSLHHLAAHGEAHLTRNSRAHIVATIRGRLGDANTGQTSGQLATFKAATSRLHLAVQIRPPDYLARDARN